MPLGEPYSRVKLDSQWRHLVATYDGVRQKIYIDGKETGSRREADSVPNASTVSTVDAHIGSHAKAKERAMRMFSGELDDIAAHALGLSREEVRSLYLMGTAGKSLSE